MPLIDGGFNEPRVFEKGTLLRKGQKIGDYEPLQVISDSNGRKILRVQPIGIRKDLAMKIVAPEHRDRLKREKESLEQLTGHPNIVEIHAQNVDHETEPYIVVDYGQHTLREILRYSWIQNLRENEDKSRLITAVTSTLFQILDGLSHAHDRWIYHLDLKPENILVHDYDTTKGNLNRVKLCDFGAAQQKLEGRLQNSNPTGTVRGTEDYMPPEQKTGKPDNRSDIYALGVLTYEMLTGKLPDRVSPKPSDTVKTPQWLDDFVYKCIDENPDKRFRTAKEAKEFVEKGLTGEHKTSLWTKIKSWLPETGDLKEELKWAPLYALGVPIFPARYLIDKADNARNDTMGNIFGFSAVIASLAGTAFYIWAAIATPQHFLEKRLENAIKQDKPTGTIVATHDNKIYFLNAEDIRRGDNYPQTYEMPVDGIHLFTATEDEQTFYFTASTFNTKTGNNEWALYKLPRKTLEPEKLASTNILDTAYNISTIDGQVSAVIKGERWDADKEKQTLIRSNLAPPNTTQKRQTSPDGKYQIDIDKGYDLEITFDDNRVGDIDLIDGNLFFQVKNPMWLKTTQKYEPPKKP